MTFPRWFYHATEKARIVKDPSELEALGDGWVTNPGLLNAVKESPQEPVIEAAQVKPKGKKNASR